MAGSVDHRLTPSGTTATEASSGYWSSTGTTWTQIGTTVTLANAGAAQDVGMVEMSHEAAAKSADFSQFAIDTDPSAPEPQQPSEPLTCATGPVSDEFDSPSLLPKWTLRNDPALARSIRLATAEQREVRRELAGVESGRDGGTSLELGIGGSRRPERLKCLHAHVAFALARPGYDLGERILGELEPLWPEMCCTDSTATH